MNTNSKGYCYLCGATLEKTAMKNHFSKFHECKSGQDCYLLKIEGGYAKDYWLYIDIPLEKTLRDIDTFLRKIWLECCGHLSSFHDPDDLIHTFIPKSSKLKSITAGECITHLYDYGTTSHTYITFIETITREPQRKNVRLLARNAPIIFQCEDCGSQAEYKYEYFFDGSSRFLCTKCGRGYSKDEYTRLPIVNSPRMGMCGYTGELDSFAFNPNIFQNKKKKNG